MNRKFNYIFFAVATVSAVIMRTVMLFFVIDPTSGFTKSEYTLPTAFMLAVIAAALALTYVFARLTKASEPLEGRPSGLLFAAASLFLAGTVVYDTFFSDMDYIVPSWQKNAEIVFALASAAVLVILAVSAIIELRYPPMITLIPLLFWLMRLVIVFSSYATLSNISDNLFELASLCLILIFSLQFAKAVCTRFDGKSLRRTFGISLLASAMCFTNSVPRAIVVLSGNAALLHTNDMPLITTLAFGLFALAFCLQYFPVSEKKSRH